MLNIVPKIVRILIKIILSQNRQNFDEDEIVVFSAGFENSSVLWCTRIFRFSEKLKKALIFAVF